MNLQLSSAASLRLQVEAGQILTLPRVEDLCVETIKGAFWITSANSQPDHVLQPGERMHLAHSRKVVMEALEPGMIQLLVSDPASMASQSAHEAAAPAPASASVSDHAPHADCMRQHVQDERLRFRSLEFA